jgi:hypothetical protein
MRCWAASILQQLAFSSRKLESISSIQDLERNAADVWADVPGLDQPA